MALGYEKTAKLDLCFMLSSDYTGLK